MKDKNKIKHFSFQTYFYTLLFHIVLGLVDSVYLSISHYRVYTDIGYQSFCAITKAVSCDTVSQSPYSIFMEIPVPIWGVFGYLFLLMIVGLAGHHMSNQKRMWALIFFFSIIYSFLSLLFAFILTFYVHSYCIFCIFLYAINLMILYFTWLIRRRFVSVPLISDFRLDLLFLLTFRGKAIVILISFFAFVGLTKLSLPSYWHIEPPQNQNLVSTGLTEDGHPWIGATQPKLIITEFTDYQCFQCKKMHFYLRQLISNNFDKIRVIHRNFPMDHKFNPIVKKPFHVGSGNMALIAIYSISEGKFWNTNDVLFEIGLQKRAFNTKEIAQKARINLAALTIELNRLSCLKKLNADILEGIKLGITGTPSYVINGQIFSGFIPSEIIQKGLR